MNHNKNYTVLIVIVVLLSVLVLVLGGLIVFGNFFSQGKSEDVMLQEDEMMQEDMTTQGDNFAIPDLSADTTLSDYIYDADYSYVVPKESYDTGYQIYYVKDIVVPSINIDSADAQNANREISSVFARAIDTFSTGCNDNLTYVECNYEATLHGNLLSVVITFGVGATDVVPYEYYTYCFDIATGKLLRYEDVYKAVGFDDANAVDHNAQQAIIAHMSEYNNAQRFIDESIANYKQSVSNRTIRFYVNSDQELCVVVLFHVPAGSGQYNDVINLNVY